jgi:hypothetical protein
MKKLLLAFLCIFFVQFTFAQITYFSKAAATDFNDVNTWGNGPDGSGASPAVISDADIFRIANGSSLTLNANATVRRLEIASGKLIVAANTLTVQIPNQNNSAVTISNGGSIEISAGTIDVRGGMYFANGSGLTQSGGLISIDGNNGGVAATSIAAGFQHFGIGTAAGQNGTATEAISSANVGKFLLTGGEILIVDGAAPATNGGQQLFGYRGGTNVNLVCGKNHTVRFGDGVSTDQVGNAAGFNMHTNLTGVMTLGNFVIDIAPGTNRYARNSANLPISGNLTITQGEFINNSFTYLEGNLINEGVFTNPTGTTFSFQKYVATSPTGPPALAPIPNTQTISGAGVFRNTLATTQVFTPALPGPVDPTANFGNLIVNNTSGAALEFPKNMISGTGTGSISGTLTLTNGYVDNASDPIIMGTAATAAGAGVSIAAANNAAILGEVQHWFPAGTTTTQKNYQVGILGRNNNFAMRFPAAITTGGKVSVKFVNTALSTTGLPLVAEAGNANVAIDKISPSGNWVVEPVGGLTLGTGNYTVNANATGFTRADGTTLLVAADLPGLALIKRATGGSWAAGTSGVAGQAGLNNFFRQNMTDFSEFAIGGTAAALPIKLASFEGKATGSSNTLSWTSESEINGEKYVIQTSSNGEGFYDMGTVKSKASNGNSTTSLKYTFIDENPKNQTQYYRLKMVDLDGTFSLSDIITIERSKSTLQIVNVKPNPTSGLISFNVAGFDNDVNVSVSVSDMTGKTVMSKKSIQSKEVSLDMQSLPNGLYMIEVRDNSNNDKVTRRIIKQQ